MGQCAAGPLPPKRIIPRKWITPSEQVVKTCQDLPKIAPEIFPPVFGSFDQCFTVAAPGESRDSRHVAQSTLNMKRTHPFPATTPSRTSTAGRVAIGAGTYRVLATLEHGSGTYRVLADLIVGDNEAQLRLFRFTLPRQDEWFSERKVNLLVSHPEIVPLVENIGDAEYVLRDPMRLDEVDAAAVFGEGGPPIG